MSPYSVHTSCPVIVPLTMTVVRESVVQGKRVQGEKDAGGVLEGCWEWAGRREWRVHWREAEKVGSNIVHKIITNY